MQVNEHVPVRMILNGSKQLLSHASPQVEQMLLKQRCETK